jgi:purine-binding chemotaxis protein CheW
MAEEKTTQINSYLTFKLGEEEFAAHVSKVLNILEMKKITKVPKAPEYMKGVINLRGMVLPVVDTRIKFGLPETEYTDQTCIVVMDLDIGEDIVHVGALVDEVSAVIEIDEEDIGPPPSIGTTYKSEFISGVTKSDESFIMILDLIKIFSTSDINMLKESQKLQTQD